jgi:hypothetical protein
MTEENQPPEPKQKPEELEGSPKEVGGKARSKAIGGELGRAKGGTGTKKDMVRSKSDKDRPFSCGKDCSTKLVTPTDGATDVGAWEEQPWMGGAKAPPS